MALPNDTGSLEYSYDGSPWCRLAAKAGIGNTLEYSYDGSPWFSIEASTAPTGHIFSINGIAWEHVDSYESIAQSHIDKALGIEG